MDLILAHDAIINPGSLDSPDVDGMARRFIEGFPSAHTRRALTGDLTAPHRRGTMSYFAWCRAAGVEPLAVAKAQARAWPRYLSELDLSGSTIQRKVSTVRCFYRHVIDVEEQLEVNPFPERNSSLRLPGATTEAQARALTVAEWLAIRAAAERAGAWRDVALLTTLLYQGLRAAEACSLDQSAMWWESGKQLMRVKGKGRKVRTIVVDPEVTSALEHMRATRRYTSVVAPFTGQSRLRPVFTDERGHSMTTDQLTWVVTRWAVKSGVQGKVTPHCYRHTCATLMLSAGVPLRDVQLFLGHANPTTTGRYDARVRMIEDSPVHTLHEAVAAATRKLVRS